MQKIYLLLTYMVCEWCAVHCSDCEESPDDILCKGRVIDHLYGVHIFDVSSRGISELSPGTLDTVSNFTRIDVSNNSLTEIKNGVFINLNFLAVDLSLNYIDSIETQAFDNMTELRYLRLDFNYINRWDPHWFKNTPNLHQLSVTNNYLTEIPENAFQNIEWIHNYDLFVLVKGFVSLERNRIVDVHPGAFGNKRELGRISFAHNRIERFSAEIFAQIDYVEELDFSYNILDCNTVMLLLNVDNVENVYLKYQNVNVTDVAENLL